MAGVGDRALKGVGPWPQGMNNLAKEGRLPTDENGRAVALREADNLDLDRSGFPSRRPGTTRFFTGTLTHSLWSHDDLAFGLFVDDGTLQAVQPDGSAQSLGVAMGNLPVSYDLFGDRVFYSNRLACGMVSADLGVQAWAPEQPGGQPQLTAVAGFGLNPGQYQVAVTFTDVLGRESGSQLAAAVVDLAEGQGIAVSQIPPALDPDTVRVNLYLSDANDQVLRLHSALAPGVAFTILGTAAQGRALATQFLTPMPPGQIVRQHNGRQYLATGRLLRWSPPLRYGLTDLGRNVVGFNADIDLMEPVGRGTDGAGVFVAAGKRTYWHGGADPANWTQTIAYGHGAVPGTSITVPASVLGLETTVPAVVWLDRNGLFCVGLPGGQVLPLKQGELVVDNADRGAALLRERDGLRQIVTALRGARGTQGLAIGDQVVAHVLYDETAPAP